jgi:hypothetical protein
VRSRSPSTSHTHATITDFSTQRSVMHRSCSSANHFTSLPSFRARLRVVQYLHEELGFDTLALEGSLTQTWLAQEHLYRSTDPARVARAQEIAWFMLWRTPAMREVMAYVDATRTTPHPLYLTSFDIQVGTSAANQGGPGIVTDLFAALRAYGPPPDPGRELEM